uniref:(northern house mosquito) hypothetical protein n=1 Tax=Culex pipiens TaxID=7175 RepID=A0A8D8H325_CULPI
MRSGPSRRCARALTCTVGGWFWSGPKRKTGWKSCASERPNSLGEARRDRMRPSGAERACLIRRRLARRSGRKEEAAKWRTAMMGTKMGMGFDWRSSLVVLKIFR